MEPNPYEAPKEEGYELPASPRIGLDGPLSAREWSLIVLIAIATVVLLAALFLPTVE